MIMTEEAAKKQNIDDPFVIRVIYPAELVPSSPSWRCRPADLMA